MDLDLLEIADVHDHWNEGGGNPGGGNPMGGMGDWFSWLYTEEEALPEPVRVTEMEYPASAFKEGEANLNELKNAIGQVRRALKGKTELYRAHESTITQAQAVHAEASAMRFRDQLIRTAGGRHLTVKATPEEFNRVARASYDMWVPKLQAIYNEATGNQDFVPQTGASMYMSPYTYLSTSVEPAESFLDKWMPKIMGKEDTDLFMTQTEWTLDPETNQQFIDWQKKNEEWLASTGGWSPGEVHPDVAQAEAKKAQYKSDVRNSSNPTAEMTKPGPDRVAASKGLTPEQMTALVGMMFTGVDQFQQQQLKMELLRAQSQGVPVQAPPVVLQQAQQQAQTPVALIAIIGIGVLAAGAMAFLAMR